MQKNQEDAERKIDKAFDSTLRPHLDTLVTGKSWQDQDILEYLEKGNGVVDNRFVATFWDSLPNFTPQGLICVLPHYMRVALTYPDSDVAQRVIYRIHSIVCCPGRHLEAFNAEQIEALRTFVAAMTLALNCPHDLEPLCEKLREAQAALAITGSTTR